MANTYQLKLAGYQSALEIGKIVMRGVQLALRNEFPDVVITPLSTVATSEPLQPDGNKLRVVIEVQISTKQKAPTE